MSVFHKTDLHFQSDDANNQVILPITPPPAQFMDSPNYGKAKAAGQEQCLGSVPEEEESDWSEMGDETPRYIMTGSSRGQAWLHLAGDAGKAGEFRHHSPRPPQSPNLQYTINNEILPFPPSNVCPSGFNNLPDGIIGEGIFRLATSPNHGSAILVRSTSLEEIPLACHQLQQELRGAEVMMHLHHPGDQTIEDLDNEIIHHWITSKDRDCIGRPMENRTLEADNLQSAEQIINHFMCESQGGEVKCQGRAEVHGWTGVNPEEVLKGEQTQL